MRILVLLSVLAALVALIGVSLGGRIYRWEMITQLLVLIFWIIMVWIFDRPWRNSQ